MKRRRTKRQRSLLEVSALDPESSRSDQRGDGGRSEHSYCSSSSPSMSYDHDMKSEITSEEEDMANCLMLLAQGIQIKTSSVTKHKLSNGYDNVSSTRTTTNNNNNNIGVHVFECKTCNKSFRSFQALGGHRTSHKQIKPPPTSNLVSSLDYRDKPCDAVVNLNVMEFTSVNKIDVQSHDHHDKNNSKAKVHECSICGSGFPSGQALGGHMRRHRVVAPPQTTVSPGSSEAADTVVEEGGGGPKNILSLDLNLPAPNDQDDNDQVHENHHMDSKFVHVLPEPAPLVDCHY